MLKKVLRWFLIVFGVVLLLLMGGAVWVNNYLSSGRDRLLNDLAETSGLEVTFRDFDFWAWETFPVVTLSVDSLVIRDRSRPVDEPALLRAKTLSGAISLSKLLQDTLVLESFRLSDGGIYITRDSTGKPNFGLLTEGKDTTAKKERSLLNPDIDWNGVDMQLSNMDVSFRHDHKHKRMAVQLDSLQTTAELDALGRLRFLTDIETQVKGIAFNTNVGSYLENSSLAGQLEMTRHDTAWVLSPTELKIGPQRFGVALEVGRGAKKSLDLWVDNAATDYDLTLDLMPEYLRRNMKRYHVSGPFPVSMALSERPEQPKDPEISIDFDIKGQDLRILDFNFRKVHTRGTFKNRLDEREGGMPGSTKNVRIALDSTRGYYEGIYVRTPYAVLRGTADDIRYDGPLRVNGPATAINESVGTKDFIFRSGRFTLNTYVNESLNSVDKIITSSDGRLSLRNAFVFYRPAGIRFPFKTINLNKQADDIRFDLQSGVLKTGFTFGLEGTMDNLLPLLLDRPADSIRTDVTLTAPHLGWTDFLAIFGEDGVLAAEEGVVITDEQRKQSMKTALLGLQSSFRPRIEARIDTVAYYDVFAVNNFSTGLRFDRDTLVLERTTFNWEGSDIEFGARIGLAEIMATPFKIDVNTEHLDLNRLRPSLEYFGLSLPDGLDTLPEDLSIDFHHRGVINDTFGIQPGFNVGDLVFSEGRSGLFSGELAYRPSLEGLRTELQLIGKPKFVNQLFAAEDFFFGSGTFRIDMEMLGTPASLSELVENSSLRLQIDSSRVTYRPAAVYLPIRRFTVDAKDEQATYYLQLFSDSTRSYVEVNGTLDRLTAFLYPELGRTFSMKADAVAQTVRWSDFKYLMPPDTFARGNVRDTVSLDPQYVLSATKGIFASFSPDLSLQVDTFWADDATRFTNIFTGLHLLDSTQLVLEESGFNFGDGQVRFSAEYNLDKRLRSPFSMVWETEDLSLRELLSTLKRMDVSGLDQLGELAGELTMNGDVEGRMDEDGQRVMMQDTRGNIKLLLSDGELNNWPELETIGKKMMMKKRFERVDFGPLLAQIRFDSGRVWLPRTEIQSTPLQLFVEGVFDALSGPEVLVSVPLRNIGRGGLEEAPAATGYAMAGRKIYLVLEPDKDGVHKVKFRLGRRRFYRERGRLDELLELKRSVREERKRQRVLRKDAKRSGRGRRSKEG